MMQFQNQHQKHQKKKVNKYYFNLIFVLISTYTLGQNSDTLKFKCTCLDKSKQEIVRTIFFKSTSDSKYVVNFNIEKSSNDTLIINDSKIYLKTINIKNILFDFKNSKFKSVVYPHSGLGFKVYHNGKQKVDKLCYYKIGFDSFATEVPFISSLTINEKLNILSFIYYDSNKQYNCIKQ